VELGNWEKIVIEHLKGKADVKEAKSSLRLLS
jgi:hypothetical protein